MRRNHAHRHLIHPAELRAPLPGRAGHAAQQRIPQEILLIGDRGDGDALPDYLELFLDLKRLPQPVAVAAPVEHAARMRVHNLQLSVRHDIVHIALERAVRLNRLKDHVRDAQVIVKALQPEKLLGMPLPQRGEDRDALLLQHDVIVLSVEPLVFVVLLERLHGYGP